MERGNFQLATDSCSDCILLMEDEELVSSIAMQMLEFIGYDSVLAVDGGQAIELYKKRYLSGSPFTGVIMDLTIPNGLGGEQTVQELLKIDSSAKVIVSSGYSDEPAMVKYDDFGFLCSHCQTVQHPVINGGTAGFKTRIIYAVSYFTRRFDRLFPLSASFLESAEFSRYLSAVLSVIPGLSENPGYSILFLHRKQFIH